MSSRPARPTKALIALVLFGVSFGYVEAAVVVYLRAVYEPLVLEINPERNLGDLFPIITLEDLEAADPNNLGRLRTEIWREAATMFLLVSAGLAVGWNFNTCFAAFIIGFGVWDIFYYVFLRVLINWPTSLLEWDLLFLIPVPWIGPVLAPVLVALTMIGAGTIILIRESAGRPVNIAWWHWAIGLLGGLVIILSFCWDYQIVMAGGTPPPFRWWVFFAGLMIGMAALPLALFRQPTA